MGSRARLGTFMSSATLKERQQLSGATEPARFEERLACVCCGAVEAQVVWSGHLSDAGVLDFLSEFHYAGDALQAVSDAPFRLVRCNQCDMQYHQNVLGPAWLKKLYGVWINADQIEHFEARVHRGDHVAAQFERGRQLTKHVLRLARLVGQDGRAPRLLDFGCGDGDFLTLASLYGFESYGLDFSASRAERSRHRSVCIVSNLEELDKVSKDPFDAITLFETLEHVTDPRGLLHELKTRLDDQGVLVVEVPNCDGITVPRTLSEFHAVQPLEHINAFTPKTLVALCGRSGFVPCRKPTAHVTTYWSALARSAAGRLVRRPSTQMYFKKALSSSP